ncbi:hypothetical protein [Hydrogenophaga sp.]|jgi:hypothetical protein|nr:hypothetical protein [Hydrogenophaga sp.]
MANVFAMHSVCASIAMFLQNTYPVSRDGLSMPSCRFGALS